MAAFAGSCDSAIFSMVLSFGIGLKLVLSSEYPQDVAVKAVSLRPVEIDGIWLKVPLSSEVFSSTLEIYKV